MSVEWNLEPFSVPETQLIEIYYSERTSEESPVCSNRRLLILAHSLAYSGIPAFFLETAPMYMKYRPHGPVVVVFDIYNNFANFSLPDYWAVYSQYYSFSQNFDDAFYDHLQRGINLTCYYALKHLKPLYFTSYLLLPRSESRCEAILYQKIPIRVGKSLRIRTSIKGSLDFVIDAKCAVPIGSYVLVSPWEHPFLVTGKNHENLMLLSVERKMTTINWRKDTFVLMTKPPMHMSSFYLSPSKPVVNDRVLVTQDFYKFDKSKIEHFLRSRFTEEMEEEKTQSTDYLDLSVEQLLFQSIEDKKKRKVIFDSIGNAALLPSHRCDIHLTVANFLSFFRFDFGFSDVKPPHHAQTMITGSMCSYERLGIPNVQVNVDGVTTEIPANEVVARWMPCRYKPISGPKSARFIVVCSSDINIDDAKMFFKELSHIYKAYEFGTLSRDRRFQAYTSLPVDEIGEFVMNFYRDQPLSEYQDCPLLTFIVGPPIFDKWFAPHSIISYVRPESILTASTDVLATFAFVVYSRIKLFVSQPFGKIDMAPYGSASIFFGYRYQPPFILPKHSDDNSKTIHIAWDPCQQMSVWIDEIGSILHYIGSERGSIEHIVFLMNDCCRLLSGTSVSFTISVLAEGLSEASLAKIQTALGPLRDTVTIFSIAPEPTIQVLFEEDFQDDSVIFSDAEQFRASSDDEFAEPLCTCYVVAHTLPAYSISLYSCQRGNTPKDTLTCYATQMSHLSWLSVKPGSENRTISYPPHISALLRKNSALTRVISRYEFLPSMERI